MPMPGRDGPEFLSSFWTSTRHYLGNEIVAALLSLLGLLVFTQLLEPSEYGRYALAVAVGSIGLTLGVEWVQASVLRLLPAYGLPRNRGALRTAALAATSVGVLLFALAILAGAAFAPAPLRLVLLMGLLYTVLGAGFMVGTSVLQAGLRSARFLLFRTGFSLMRILFGLLFLILVSRSWPALLAASLVSFLIATLALWPDLRPGLPLLSPQSRAGLRSILRFGIPLTGWFFANQILNLSDRFLIEMFLGSEAVGRYSVSYGLVAGLSAAALQPPLAAAYPLLVRSRSRDGGARAGARLGGVIDRVILVVLPLLAGLAFFGTDLLKLIVDRGYVTSLALLILLAAGLSVWQISLYLQKAFELDMRTRRLFLYAALAALANLTLNLILIPRFGIEGAATATFGAYLLYAGLLIRGGAAGLPLMPRASTLLSALISLGAFMPFALASLWIGSPLLKLGILAPLSLLSALAALRWRGEWGRSRKLRP